jgi:hypothetical protein
MAPDPQEPRAVAPGARQEPEDDALDDLTSSDRPSRASLVDPATAAGVEFDPDVSPADHGENA